MSQKTKFLMFSHDFLSFVVMDFIVDCWTSLLRIPEVWVQISARKQFILTVAFLISYETSAGLEHDTFHIFLTYHPLHILEIDVM
jgi:hypothetical protein